MTGEELKLLRSCQNELGLEEIDGILASCQVELGELVTLQGLCERHGVDIDCVDDDDASEIIELLLTQPSGMKFVLDWIIYKISFRC